MKIQIERSNNLFTHSDIQHFEGFLDCRFPEDYKEFLLTYNGGHIESNLFKSIESDESFGVRHFFGVNTRNDLDISKILKTYKNRVPLGILPIGDDDCGNLFCLSLRNKDYSAVYFWDHELEAEEDEPPTESNLSKLASSFSEFLNGLTPFNIDDLELPAGIVVSGNIEFLKSVGADPKIIEELEKKQKDSSS